MKIASFVEIEQVGSEILLLDTRNREVVSLPAPLVQVTSLAMRELVFAETAHGLAADLVHRGLADRNTGDRKRLVSRRTAVAGSVAASGALVTSLAFPAAAQASSVIAGEGTWQLLDGDTVVYFKIVLSEFPEITSDWYDPNNSTITVPGGTGLDYDYSPPEARNVFQWSIPVSGLSSPQPSWFTDELDVEGVVSYISTSLRILFRFQPTPR